MKKMNVALATLLALACNGDSSVAVTPPPPALHADTPAPVKDVRMGDTLEIEVPTAVGGVPPYAWTYRANASYLHIVSQDPLRVYASDGGHPTLTATVRDDSGQTATVDIELRLIPRSLIEGRWYMAHTLDADTVQLWMDLMPGNPWCPDMGSAGACTNPNCATMSDGYPGYWPCPARGFSVGGQVAWKVRERDAFWPDPFVWLPWEMAVGVRPSFFHQLDDPQVLLNIGVDGGLGICERGTYAEFRGSLNDDATELSGTLTYECEYMLPGIPEPWNPTGNVTFHLQPDAYR